MDEDEYWSPKHWNIDLPLKGTKETKVSKKKTHTGAHLYERFETKSTGKILYRCMIPGCTHHIWDQEMMINRISRCWGTCNKEFVLSKEIIDNGIKKPLCDDCKEERKERRKALQDAPTVE